MAYPFGAPYNDERQRYGYGLGYPGNFGRRQGLPPHFEEAYHQEQRRRDLCRQALQPRYRQSQHQRSRQAETADHWRKSPSISGYVDVKRLGVGGLSESVKIVRYRRTSDLRVVKRVGSKARPREELEILKRIPRHCHLNYMVEYAWLPNMTEVNLVLEYCDLGDLGHSLEDHINANQSFSEDFVWHMLHSTGKALAFLHSGITDTSKQMHSQAAWDTICHLDIKPANIFMSSSGRKGQHPRMVLGDFGCCVTKSDIESGREHKQEHRHGTHQWFPPHSLSDVVGSKNRAYGWHTDIWQLGAVAASLCRLTFKPNREQVFRDCRFPCGSRYSQRLNETVKSCVRSDRTRRPRAANLARSIQRR